MFLVGEVALVLRLWIANLKRWLFLGILRLVGGIICRELTVGWVGGRRVRVSLRLILLMSQPSKIKSFFLPLRLEFYSCFRHPLRPI